MKRAISAALRKGEALINAQGVVSFMIPLRLLVLVLVLLGGVEVIVF
jgi:hypothetical protein